MTMKNRNEMTEAEREAADLKVFADTTMVAFRLWASVMDRSGCAGGCAYASVLLAKLLKDRGFRAAPIAGTARIRLVDPKDDDGKENTHIEWRYTEDGGTSLRPDPIGYLQEVHCWTAAVWLRDPKPQGMTKEQGDQWILSRTVVMDFILHPHAMGMLAAMKGIRYTVGREFHPLVMPLHESFCNPDVRIYAPSKEATNKLRSDAPNIIKAFFQQMGDVAEADPTALGDIDLVKVKVEKGNGAVYVVDAKRFIEKVTKMMTGEKGVE